MAGIYPDAPSRRMAWDADGSIGFGWQASGRISPVVEVTPTERAELNDEDSVNVRHFSVDTNTENWIGVLFPELREIDGLFAAISNGSIGQAEVSEDTTNTQDGTWTTLVADMPNVSDVYADYRNQIVSTAANAKRAVRVLKAGGSNPLWRALHVYGEISPGETPDRLLFIDEATGLEFDLPKDFGDVPRGSARQWQFRLKNNSTAAGNNLTINTIQFTAEDLYLGSGNWYTFSVGGDPFAGTKQISSLAPEAESPLIVGRQIIPADAQLGKHAARIRVTHTSLS